MEVVQPGRDLSLGYIKCPYCGAVLKIYEHDIKRFDIPGIERNLKNKEYNESHEYDYRDVDLTVKGWFDYDYYSSRTMLGIGRADAVIYCGSCFNDFAFDSSDFRPVTYEGTKKGFFTRTTFYKKLYPGWNKRTGRIEGK